MSETVHSALVLFSGGQDSATCLAWALERYQHVETIGFDYGQRHRLELRSARRIAVAAGVVEHSIQRLDLRAYGGSALTADIAVPKDREAEQIRREYEAQNPPKVTREDLLARLEEKRRQDDS